MKQFSSSRIKCPKCNDTGIDPKISFYDEWFIEGYCSCLIGAERADKEVCGECGEMKEDCVCGI